MAPHCPAKVSFYLSITIFERFLGSLSNLCSRYTHESPHVFSFIAGSRSEHPGEFPVRTKLAGDLFKTVEVAINSFMESRRVEHRVEHTHEAPRYNTLQRQRGSFLYSLSVY